MRFIHTADIHLGKTYRNAPGEAERYDDFFRILAGIVERAVAERVDFVLICGDLFHTGRILPRTFARTIEALQPLKDARIPCIAIEGNHDWIHRREAVSWMEALSEMGYISLLRPERLDNGGYHFAPFSRESGGGHIEIDGLNIYGLGYIGARAGSHVERICEAVTTDHNLLLFHVGIWRYAPVEIGNMKLDEAHPLAETFSYVALGHGHKPYVIETPAGIPYAFNPGAPERVNFGEEEYDKGFYLVSRDNDTWQPRFIRTEPRPMLVERINMDGAENADAALSLFRERMRERLETVPDNRAPLIEVKLTGRVPFHPFELGRETLKLALDVPAPPLHVEIQNHLSMVTRSGGQEEVKKSLAEIERDVLHELISARNDYQGRESELTRLALDLRDLVLRGDADDEELLELLRREA